VCLWPLATLFVVLEEYACPSRIPCSTQTLLGEPVFIQC